MLVTWSNSCRLMRPRQWIKNLLLFAAPLTAGKLDSISNVKDLVLAFIAFSFISSFGYICNDWRDRHLDSANPIKSMRPFAEGSLKLRHGIAIGFLLFCGSFVISLALPNRFVFFLFLYLLVTLSYSFFLKKLAVVEMIVLSLGFLIRPIAGAAVIDIPVSEWFLIVVGFASLFMVSTKRLSEYKKTNSLRTRGVLELYSDRFLESVLTLSIAVTITTYSLWAFSVYPNSIWPKLSIIPVLTALLRYSWLRDRGNAESPELLLFEDKLLPVLGFVGFVFLAIAIYG